MGDEHDTGTQVEQEGKNPSPTKNDLAPQAELLDERAVAVEIFLLEIVEMAAALAHDLEQTTTRMMILRVRLEMFLETRDPFRQK
jgi:hypothetical protein